MAKDSVCIERWMVDELGLKRGELLCYALIYRDSQGDNVFSKRASYIAKWLNIDYRTVFAVLKHLCEKGLITKIEKKVKNISLPDYKATRTIVKKKDSE